MNEYKKFLNLIDKEIDRIAVLINNNTFPETSYYSGYLNGSYDELKKLHKKVEKLQQIDEDK